MSGKVGIATSGAIKADHYHWDSVVSNGRDTSIPIELLRLDAPYQRDEVSNLATLKRARSFNADIAGRILVGRRADDGSYYVIDGKQRTLAALRRGDVREMKVRLIEETTLEQEADLFQVCNLERKSVSAWAKWNAGRISGDPDCIAIAEKCSDMGISIVPDGNHSNTITAVALLLHIYKTEQSLFVPSLRAAKTICEGTSVKADVIKGCLYLLKRGVCVDDHAARLASKGGPVFVNQNIAQVQIETGNAGLSNLVCGLGLLTAINKNLRRKISLSNKEVK